MFVFGHSFNEAIESFIALGRLGNPLHLGAVKVLSYILPNFDVFDFRLMLIHGESLRPWDLSLATLYGVFYLSAMLLLSIDRMNRSDI